MAIPKDEIFGKAKGQKASFARNKKGGTTMHKKLKTGKMSDRKGGKK